MMDIHQLNGQLYVLDGSFGYISENRAMYENLKFLLDIQEDGNKIIEAISSKREEYEDDK